MNRKGEYTLLQIATIIAGILAAAILAMIVLKMASKEGLYSTFSVKDSAMLADAMHAVPQNARVSYSTIFQKGTVSFASNNSYAVLGRDFIGLLPLDLKGEKFVYASSFIPSVPVFAVKSSSPSPVFFLIKEGRYLFMSLTPSYNGLELRGGEANQAPEQ